MNATDQTVRKDASMNDRPHPQGELSASYKNAPPPAPRYGRGVEFVYRELVRKRGHR